MQLRNFKYKLIKKKHEKDKSEKIKIVIEKYLRG